MQEQDIQAISQFWAPRAAVKPEDPRARPGYFYIGPNNAGVRVTHETAVQVAAVWACIDVIAKAISSSDWLVYERQGSRKRIEVDPFEDRLGYVLNTRPNPEMTAQAFRRALMIAALSWGNGYAEIVRDRAGRVGALYPIAPDRVEPFRDESGELLFEVKNDSGTSSVLSGRDIFHVRGPSIVGMMGDDIIAKASGSIALSIATDKFAASYFGNGTHLGGIVEVPGGMDDPTFERLKREFNQNHKGVGNAMKVAFIENGMKWHPVDGDADKSQLIGAQQNNVETICRWFGVPPHKVQHLLRSTNNNIEHQGLEFVRDALRPWARELQQEADFKLFSSRGPARYTLIDLDWAAEGDFKSRAEGLQILRNIGALNGDEVRDAIGYDSMPDGDKYIVQGAMVELKDVGKAYDKGATTTAKPAGGDGAPAQKAALSAWVGATFNRVRARYQARLADLERGGRDDAAAMASADARTYLSQQLAPVLPHLAAFSGRDVSDAAERAGVLVLGGEETEAAVAALFTQLGED